MKDYRRQGPVSCLDVRRAFLDVRLKLGAQPHDQVYMLTKYTGNPTTKYTYSISSCVLFQLRTTLRTVFIGR